MGLTTFVGQYEADRAGGLEVDQRGIESVILDRDAELLRVRRAEGQGCRGEAQEQEKNYGLIFITQHPALNTTNASR